MRNLKRALSLTLASVMLLGMMVVGAGAASYPDVDEKDNIEAIEVLQAVKVMVGDEKGNFGPDQPVNRAQMAVVMALLLDLDYDYYEGSNPFKDVPAWAAPYVAACYANGIVSGYDAVTYGSGDPVTAVQAASMMMRALGYFKYPSDYSNNGGFELATVKQASKIDLFRQINANAKDPLTRNQVAQLALNALKTPIVEADDNTFNLVDGNGNLVVTGGQVNYVVTASSQAFARAIDDTESNGNALNGVTGYIIELGEKLYNGKLKLTDDIDAFNRPARNWEFEGKTIGLYAKKELMEMENVGTVTGKDLYDLLGKTKVSDYSIEVALDGVTDPEIVFNAHKANGESGYDDAGSKKNVHFVFDKDDINRSNNGSLGATGTGVLTQVFVDPDYDNGTNRPSGKVWIAVINTYLARASQDYDSKREELTLNAYSVVKSSGEYVKLDKNSAAQQVRLSVEEFPAVKDAKESDAFLVTFAEGEVQSAVPAEVLSAVKVSSFKVKDNVVVDGTTYKFSTTAGWDANALKAYTGNELVNLKDRTYNIFLDAYENLIGVQEVDAVKNYVFISALNLNDSNLVNGTADAKAIFLDGTVDTIRVNMDKSVLNYYGTGAAPGGYNKNSILNTWCTYTKNNSDVYTVKQVVDVTNAPDGSYLPKENAANNSTGLAQYHQTAGGSNFPIDKKHITLNGHNIANVTDFSRVYGNEKTVYLTAELSSLTNQGGTWGVIKGVDTVTTGIENTNLSVWTDAEAVSGAEDNAKLGIADTTVDGKKEYASKGVYTLYDDDGIVIAAVVVGEDDGTARNLVYVHSGSVDYEAWNGSSSSRADGDGMWTWARKVISDGQEVTLTEVSDGDSDLAAMKQYHWYQIKTNGDGEVTGVYRLPTDNDAGTLPTAKLSRYDDYAEDYKASDKTNNIGEIAYTVQNGASTVLYWNRAFIDSQLRMNGRTLYVATDDQTGFIVSNNVKWVVQQWDSNAKETYIDEGTTATGLENMIDEINRRYGATKENGKTYTYQVSAVIENGIASSVVIYDPNNDYNRPGTDVTTPVAITVTRGEGVKNVVLSANTIKKGETVTINTIDLEAGYKNAKVEVIGAKYDETTKTISEPTGAVTVKVTATNGKIALNIKLDEADVAAGIKITEARVLTAEDIAVDPYKTAGAAAGNIWITFNVPSNVTAATNGKALSGLKNGMSVSVNSEATPATQYAMYKAANAAKLDLTAELTLAKLTTAVKHEVEVKSDVAGLTFTTITPDVAEGTTGNLKLNITKGLPAYATEVDVYYTVEGVTDDTTLKGTADAATGFQLMAAQGCASGALTTEMTLSDDAKAKAEAGNVVITIKKIVVHKQAAKVEGATPATIDVVTGTAFNLPQLTVTLGAQVNTADAIVTINGVATDDATNFPTSNRKMTLTSGKTTADSGNHYTSDGSAQVVITVTPVISELKQAGTFVALDGTTTVDSITLGGAVAVKDGTNDAEITLTLAKFAFFGNKKVVAVEVFKGADRATFKSEATAATGDVTSAVVKIPKGALTGITGDAISVVVTIENAPTT